MCVLCRIVLCYAALYCVVCYAVLGCVALCFVVLCCDLLVCVCVCVSVGGWLGSRNSVWAGRMGTRGVGGRPHVRWDDGVQAAKFIIGNVKASPVAFSSQQPSLRESVPLISGEFLKFSSFLNRKLKSAFSNEAANSSASAHSSNISSGEASEAGSRTMFDVLPECLDNEELIKLINEKPKLSVFSICTVFDKYSRQYKYEQELDPG